MRGFHSHVTVAILLKIFWQSPFSPPFFNRLLSQVGRCDKKYFLSWGNQRRASLMDPNEQKYMRNNFRYTR
jgi:hypothetical protein